MTAVEVRVPRRPLIASLPMYDLPEVQDATDTLWQAIAARLHQRGVPAPARLTRGDQALQAAWTDPDLLLSQTCGYPLMTGLQKHVAMVATPIYTAPGCEGPMRRSAVIVRAGDRAATLNDLRRRRCAVNELTSDSGMNLLRAEVSTLAGGAPFFGEVIHTGSHLASVERVAAGRADVAAIDAVTFALLQRYRPELTRNVRRLAWTVASPGLPLVTAQRQTSHVRIALQAVLTEVAIAPGLKAVRGQLMLEGFAPLRLAHYRSVLGLADLAVERGYAQLA